MRLAAARRTDELGVLASKEEVFDSVACRRNRLPDKTRRDQFRKCPPVIGLLTSGVLVDHATRLPRLNREAIFSLVNSGEVEVHCKRDPRLLRPTGGTRFSAGEKLGGVWL
jgi:hypothetical protein